MLIPLLFPPFFFVLTCSWSNQKRTCWALCWRYWLGLAPQIWIFFIWSECFHIAHLLLWFLCEISDLFECRMSTDICKPSLQLIVYARDKVIMICVNSCLCVYHHAPAWLFYFCSIFFCCTHLFGMIISKWKPVLSWQAVSRRLFREWVMNWLLYDFESVVKRRSDITRV